MNKIIAGIFAILPVVNGVAPVIAEEAAVAVSSAPAASGTAGGWEALLQSIGVNPDPTIPEQKILLRKLGSLPDIAQKIQKSMPRPMPLQEWSRLLQGMGIQPKAAMADSDWLAVLNHAGIQLEPGQMPQAQIASSQSNPAPVSAEGQTIVAQTPQAQQLIPINISPQSNAANQTPSNAPKTITLDLRGMDILEVLKLFSRQANLNMAASPNVRGSVTMFLKDVELWEALRLVLETNDLAYVQDHGVVRVMSAGDYERLYGVRFDDKTKIEVLAFQNIRSGPASKFMESVKSRVGKIIVYDFNNSLIVIDTPEAIGKMKDLALSLDQAQETRVFSINYARAEDIFSKLQSAATKDVGELEMDKRTKRIVAKDYPEKIRQMERIVAAFDGRHRTVLIEAKIIQVTLNSKFQMGVQWEHIFAKINNELIPGNVKGNFTVLPLGGLGLAANVGNLAQNNYTAFVQLLESAGKTNLLSAPRITALNNEAAKILVGTKEAYVTTTVLTPGGSSPSTTAENVNFVDVGVKLFVTPDIGEDGYIALKIRPEISSVERTLSTAQGNSIPIIRTSESETSVVAKDGETILIAGLIEDKMERSDSRIPILGAIPILGFPFRGRTTTKVKTEIVVLLTPRIITGETKG